MAVDNLTDLWAAVAAAIAAGALALRANMLKPTQHTWAPAPWPVWAGLMGLAIALAMGSVTIGTGGHATPREAVIYTALAICSVVMVWNLHHNGRAAVDHG